MDIYLNKSAINNVEVKEMEIRSKFNEHNVLLLILEMSKEVYEKNFDIFTKKDVSIEIKNNNENIFLGNVSEVIIEVDENNCYYVQIQASDLSFVLSNNHFRRIYQDFNISYKEIVEDVVSKFNLKYIISEKLNKKINRIFFQKEDDWAFLTRLYQI